MSLPLLITCSAGTAVVVAWSLLSLGSLFAKCGYRPFQAWVPVVNALAFGRIGGLVPPWLWLTVVPGINVVALVKAVTGINARFALGRRMTILAVAFPPLWLHILGRGPAVPVGGVSASPEVHVAPWIHRLEQPSAISSPRAAWALEIEEGLSVALSQATVLLGRDVESAVGDGVQPVVITDPSKTVSRRHAMLVRIGDSWSITDLGSKNGVQLRDSAGRERRIADGVGTKLGEYFRLGERTFRLRSHEQG